MAATNSPTLRITGEVDLASRDRWLALARGLITRPETAALHIDLSGVSFMDSAGLGMLITARNLADDHGVHLSVVNLPHAVR